MKKQLIFAMAVFTLGSLITPADAQSMYGHDRTWHHGRVQEGSTLPDDYLVPSMPPPGSMTRSTPPFGYYSTAGGGNLYSSRNYTPPDQTIVMPKRRAYDPYMYQQQQQSTPVYSYGTFQSGNLYQPSGNYNSSGSYAGGYDDGMYDNNSGGGGGYYYRRPARRRTK